jgi:hypothetical protein
MCVMVYVWVFVRTHARTALAVDVPQRDVLFAGSG